MRVIPLLIFSVITIVLIVIANSSLLLPVPLGKLLSPQHGVWQNADDYDLDYNASLELPQLKNAAAVYFDERLVPHVFAQNDEDLFFIQGYLHAKFRLWQMEFQTFAAAGRVSEIVGSKGLDFDRGKRRLGMVYAAENSLKEMEKDPDTRAAMNSYTAGVNTYIATLTDRTMPIEYKLLGYKPERWSNLKSALFLKFMAFDLAAREEDFEMTNAKAAFSSADFNKIYPIVMDSLDPIVPKGTAFAPPPEPLTIPATADSLYFNFKDSVEIDQDKPHPDNGSNNWAVGPSKTKSGAPILCNDPHLGLNLPSLWYEMQLSTPDMNVYGATLPGAPAVIIGFNDHIAFGVTNAMRDVRDYYEIKFKDDSRREYWFDSAWQRSSFRVEHIRVKDEPVYYDTVVYTSMGPVMYDNRFDGGRHRNHKSYAVRWKAHDPSNELKTFYLLDRATGYEDYLEAIKHFETPGQNFVFASKAGDIAIWNQGSFPAKWHRQGDFVMPGTSSDYMWQYNVPQEQNPHQINPERGFVSSANQLPTDTTYPYYLGGDYPPYRGLEINRRLRGMDQITPEDMMRLQIDNYNVFGEIAAPELVSRINTADLDRDGMKYYNLLRDWNYENGNESAGATIFVHLWDSLEAIVWKRIIPQNDLTYPWPHESTLIDLIKAKDSSLNILAHLDGDINEAFRKCITVFKNLDRTGELAWAKFKNTEVKHLTGLAPFSVQHVNIGGGRHVINATQHQHGPSWRMVVSLTEHTEAYGIYPGGQSGNPGSRYYDDFIDSWAKGSYYKLWVMKPSDASSNKVIYTMRFSPKSANN